MKSMSRQFKEKDALLRPHKETTLEKMEKKKLSRREMITKEFNKVRKDPI